MAARTSMAGLISRIRALIGDPAATAHFTDDDIQSACDARRETVNRYLLTPIVYPTSTQWVYYDYTGPGGFETAVISKTDYTTVSAGGSDAFDPINGRWRFATARTGDLYVSGDRYDIYAVAADLVERWCADLALQAFDFTDGSSFKLSQIAANLERLALKLRSQSEDNGASIRITRSDCEQNF